MSSWDEVIGHDWAVQMLRDSLAHGRGGHAYLITGPDQVGKTTLARALAQALNCTGDEDGDCRACRLIAEDRHPDVKLIEPDVSARGKLSLKIETMRQLQQDLNLSAYEARYKIAIIRRFDAASIGAANAFLKTLEEPPSNVVLILTVRDADTILPTIASRCRVLNLRPLPVDLIEQSLTTRWQVAAEEAYQLAHLADGRLGWAVAAAADQTLLQARRQQLDVLNEALGEARVRRFQIADKLSRSPEKLPAVMQTWLSWWRDVNLLVQSDGPPPAPITNVDQLDEIQALCRRIDREQALASLQQTNLALWQLERNANTRLVLENLLLTYPQFEN